MSDEVETVEQTTGQEVAVAGEAQMPSAASIFDKALVAAQSGMDAQTVAVFLDMANKQQDREAERRFRLAKHQALQQMPEISKSGAILNREHKVQSRYSKFEDIMRVVKPILAAHNLIITFNVGHEGQLVTVQPILSYSDGELAFEEKGDHMVLAVDTTGSKNATQGAGSSASYGKRHAAKAMLNIVEEAEDDDGRGGVTIDQLQPVYRDLIEDARSAAQQGGEAYEAFFKSLSPEQRGFLAFNYAEPGTTWHDQNKTAAQAVDA